jgi:hypothetical protein
MIVKNNVDKILVERIKNQIESMREQFEREDNPMLEGICMQMRDDIEKLTNREV